MKEEKTEMSFVNPNAAGIDIWSRLHFVGIGQGKEHVREFGVYFEDLLSLSNETIEKITWLTFNWNTKGTCFAVHNTRSATQILQNYWKSI